MKKTILTIAFCQVLLAAVDPAKLELKPHKLMNGRIEIMMPDGFKPMPAKMIETKYAMTSHKPEIVYTDSSGRVNVVLTHFKTQLTQKKIRETTNTYVATFRGIYPSTTWYSYGVTKINERNAGYMELLTPTIDSYSYNLFVITDLEKRMLVLNFNCPLGIMKKWKPLAHRMALSLKLAD